MARNEKESPLLKLPGELRNRIYEFVVGGHVIVIEHSGRMTTPYVPRLPVKLTCRLITSSSSLTSQSGTLAEDRISGEREGQPIEPSERVSRIFTLGLVCRQIRAETASIQYKHNIFHFHNPSAFEVFTWQLSAAQCNAIVQVSIGRVYALNTFLGLSYIAFDPSLDFASSCMLLVMLPKLVHLFIAPSTLRLLEPKSGEDKIGRAMLALGIRKGPKDDGLMVVVQDVLDHASRFVGARFAMIQTVPIQWRNRARGRPPNTDPDDRSTYS